MTNARKTLKLGPTLKLVAAAAMATLPLVVHAQPYNSNYRDEVEPTSRVSQDQAGLEQDRRNLIDARHHADDLAHQRDEQQRIVDSLIHSSGPAPASVTVTATGDVKALQRQLDDAKAKADKVHADAVARFEAGEGWKSQFSRFDQARKDLKGPTDEVLNRLSQTDDFKQLVADARTAKERADKLHADKNADPKEVKEADDAFMAADNRVQEAAEQALQADPRVADGRKVVDDAQARLHDMRDKFEQDLINDATFGPAVAQVRACQQALDAANGQPQAGEAQLAVGVGGAAPTTGDLRDAQARLDQINHDLDQARADVDALTARVRQDEQALAANGGTAPAYQPTYQAPAAAPANPQPVYDYGDNSYAGGGYDYGYQPGAYAYAPVAVYSPAVAYDSYAWWSPGLTFGLSFGSYGYRDRWCDDWYGRWCRPYSYYHDHDRYYGYGRGGDYGYSYAGRYGDYGRGYSRDYGSRGGYYEGARYGGANRYGYSSYNGGRSYDSGYQSRVNRRYDYAQADHQAYVNRNIRREDYALADHQAYANRDLRRDRYAAADYSAYRDRVQHRGAEASPRVADRSAYESRVERRAAENQPNYARQTPTYQRSSRSEAAAASPRQSADRSAYESRVQRRASESRSSSARETPNIQHASRSEASSSSRGDSSRSSSASHESRGANTGRDRASDSSRSSSRGR